VSPSILCGSEDTSGVHSVLSITPFDVGRILLLEDGDTLPLITSFLFSAFTVPLNLPGWNHTGSCTHVVEVNEWVIDGDSIHFARVESNPGVQAPNLAKFTPTFTLCLRDVAGTA
jgi:hypothetical protein